MRNSWQTEQLLMATCGIARIVHGPVETPEDTGAEKESTDAVA
jgi:hypothetical protein